jgi:transposase
MPPRTVSQDLKACIPVLYYKQNFTIKEICGLLGIKKSLTYKTLSYSSTYGVPYNPHARTGGRRQVLNREDIKFVVALIERQHCIYLDEIQEELYLHRGYHPSIPTLVHTL